MRRKAIQLECNSFWKAFEFAAAKGLSELQCSHKPIRVARVAFESAMSCSLFTVSCRVAYIFRPSNMGALSP